MEKLYFTAGPAKVPQEVMLQARNEFINYNNLDIGVCEMSHRSKEFNDIITQAEANLRKLLDVPHNYAVLFLQGGAKAQFDSVPMNLCSKLNQSVVDYLVTGSWSKMAAKDASKYANVNVQQVTPGDKFTRQLHQGEYKDLENATYRFYCDNETIHGVEFDHVPECGVENNIPLVCDMTSNFLSRPIDVRKFGVIFAGAQKNAGISGLNFVIIRKDLIGHQMSICPNTQNYSIFNANNSLYNTPPTFAIYIANLCFQWILERGGLDSMDKLCKQKSNILYDLIDNSGGFYLCPVEKSSRSRLNVVFLLKNTDLEKVFIEESRQAKLYELKGHRSVGGFRASLYHGVKIEDVSRLAHFLTEFRLKYHRDEMTNLVD